MKTPEEKQADNEKIKYTQEHLNKALHDVYDVQERILTEFILLGDAALAVHDQKPVETDCIECCIRSNQITPEVISNFKVWQFTKEPWGYSWTYSPPTLWDVKIPIRLYVYERPYALFTNPSRGFAYVESFLIPNPWDKYWAGRHLIRGKLIKGSL